MDNIYTEQMQITLVMGIFPNDEYDKIIEQSVRNIQFAADALQKSIIHGLSNWTTNLNIINLQYIGSYPLRYKRCFIPSYPFVMDAEVRSVRGTNVGFCNFTGVKLLSRYRRAKKALIDAVSKNPEQVIIVYAIHTPFLMACADVKRRYPQAKIVLVVPDLPEFMSDDNSYIRSMANKLNAKILNRLYSSVDGYVLLSKHMVERLPVSNKPWTVVEGVYNRVDESDRVTEAINTHDIGTRYILYTGTLAKRYGILNLVEAFRRVSHEDIRLVICGDGDSKEMIAAHSKEDPRIIFMGMIKREIALKLQRNAMLLVNPRTSEGEYTKYSFPSKTMEYLASGVPTLLYQLPGVPDEYYQHCFSLTDKSVNALSEMITSIIRMDTESLRIMGANARDFILSKKSPAQQAKKIIDLIQQL